MALMSEAEIIAEFEAAQAILRGHFILSSGLHSDTYLQCARVLMLPKRAEKLCAALAAKIRNTLPFQEIDLVVAPAMGGVVVGYEMARQMNLEGIFCERQDGVFALRRGFSIRPGARVLVVEDVVTTGKSSLEAYECIREAGGEVVAEASLIDRSNGTAADTLGVPYISLLELEVPTYQPDALPEHLQNIPAIKPGSRWLAAKAKTA
jgi:orotate phosphoribosyltransferase